MMIIDATVTSHEDADAWRAQVSAPLSVSRFETSLEWDRAANDWRSMSRAHGGFYLGYSWLRSWWESYGTDNLFLHTVRRGDETISIAPLTYCRTRWNGLPLNLVGSLFNPHMCRTDVAVAASEPACTRMLMDAIDERPWDVMFFREMPQRSSFLVELAELCKQRGRKLYLRPSLDSPYVAIDRDWSDYISSRSKSFCKKLRQRKNRLRASGMTAEFSCVDSAADIEALLPEVMAVARVSWSGQRGSSIASGRNRSFYETVILRLAAEGSLRIYCLRLDSALAAFEIHVPWGRVDSAIKSCYDPRFRELSPGGLLDLYVMKTLFSHREFDRYDLLGSNDRYKMQWTDDVERHVEVFVFNERLGSRVLESLEFGIRPKIGEARRRLADWRQRVGSVRAPSKGEGAQT